MRKESRVLPLARSCGQQSPGCRTNVFVALLFPSLRGSPAEEPIQQPCQRQDSPPPAPSNNPPSLFLKVSVAMSMKLPLKEPRARKKGKKKTRSKSEPDSPSDAAQTSFWSLIPASTLSRPGWLCWVSLDRPTVHTEKPCVQHLPAPTGQSRSRYFHASLAARFVTNPSFPLSGRRGRKTTLTLLRTLRSIPLLARRPRRPWASVGR